MTDPADTYEALATAPPSAPVGVEGIAGRLRNLAAIMRGDGGTERIDGKAWERVEELAAFLGALAQQPAADKFAATFRCESNGIVGYTNAPIHGVNMHDDGVVEVVIDYWPEQLFAADGYTTGHCERHKQPGGCDLHNLHCGWPACDRRPAALNARAGSPNSTDKE